MESLAQGQRETKEAASTSDTDASDNRDGQYN